MMQKAIIYLFLIIIGINQGFSQKHHSDFIITVDGDVNPNIGIITLKYKLNNDVKETTNISYHPGNLEIDSVLFNELCSKRVEILSFGFTSTKLCQGELDYYHYEFDDFSMNWLKSQYFILQIYNSKNSKIYNPLPGKSYTYTYDSSEGSMKRVQKKFTKQQKKCN